MSFVLVFVGCILLYLGGEWLVRYASDLGERLGMSPLVVGLTVVAFGTSAPELAASLTAALQGSTEMAFGNVVGSNIANLGLILGITILIHEIRATATFLRREVPFMIGASVLVVLFGLGGTVGRLEGLVLLLLIVPYLRWLFGKSEEVEALFEGEEGHPHSTSLGRIVLGVVVGSAFLVGGAKAVVLGGTDIARAYGVSERVIGLTVLALGTSLPELASSVAAALKREGDIVLGNLVGSNICNVFVILGTTSMIRPVRVPEAAFGMDLWLMIGLAVVLLPMLRGGRRMRRREGALLLLSYAVYMVVLATGPEGPGRL